MLAHAPDTNSAFWWPAHAVLGDYGALAAVVKFGMAVLAASIGLFSRKFGEHAVAAAGVSSATVRHRRWSLDGIRMTSMSWPTWEAARDACSREAAGARVA